MIKILGSKEIRGIEERIDHLTRILEASMGTLVEENELSELREKLEYNARRVNLLNRRFRVILGGKQDVA
jgi:hypothetical protein